MNWETFQKLSFQKKIQWMIQYYGVTILVTILALLVGGNLIRSFLSPEECYKARVLILDDRCSAELGVFFQTELEEMLGGVCDVIAYQPAVEVQKQAFVVRVASDKFDLLLAPDTEMKELLKNGYFENIEKLDLDSHYYEMLRESPFYGDSEIYAGVPQNGENKENQSLIKEYFCGK